MVEQVKNPKPPSGGSSAERLKATDEVGPIIEAIKPLLARVEQAILAKATSYSDARHMIDAQRVDRAHLMAALGEIIEQVDVNSLEVEDREGNRPFGSEVTILTGYREHFVSKGLFLLPNVVQVFPVDASGTTVIEVEFALADTEGRLWPACCRVAGAGNDRVAHQRGGAGDKGMARAMSAAWKEAMCRLLMLPRGHDPERYDLAHEAPIGGSRPSNQQRQQREQPLTMAQEDDIKKRIIAKLEEADSTAAVDALMKHEGTQKYLKRISGRSRYAIEQVEKDMRRGIQIAESRQGRQQQPDTRYDHEPPDDSPIGDDVGGVDDPADEHRRRSDEREYQSRNNADDDDDIPF